MRTTTLQSSKASSSLWKLFAAMLLVWILVPIGQASAQNKATESNGTEKTVIGGVDDLYGVDPSSEHCTDTKVGTNQTDGDKIVCLYNVGAKKFLSIGGLWGHTSRTGCFTTFHLYVLEWLFKNVFSSKQSGRFFCWLIYGYRLGKIYSKKWGIYGQRKF